MPPEPPTRPSLLPAEKMPRVPGLNVPADFYMVLLEPAPLAGMKYPDYGIDWLGIAGLGIQHIVCLAEDVPGYDPLPLDVLFSAQLEDLRGADPKDPMKEAQLIDEAVSAVMMGLRSREGVLIHCGSGTGRTGTVIGCVLRELGYPASDAVGYLVEMNRVSRRKAWPESPWQQANVEGRQVE